MGLLDLLFSSKAGGIIHYLNLDDFWFSLSSSQRAKMISYGKKNMGQSGSIAEGKVTSSSARPLQFLTSMLTCSISDHDYDLSDSIIRYGTGIMDNSKLVDQHFFLMTAADCYYKQRDTRDNGLYLSEQFNRADVDLFPRYKSALKREMGGVLPRIPSFSQLAIIYEKEGRYQDAIDICRLALKNGVQEKTKSGFEGRIEKLEKKIDDGLNA